MDWKQAANRLGRSKKEQIFILLLLGVLLLVIAVPVEKDTPDAGRGQEETKQGQEEAAETDAAARLEQKLRQILSTVEGIGKTEVMITLKSDGRRIVEKDSEKTEEREEAQQESGGGSLSRISSSEATVYQRDDQGNENPYVLEELEPEISGVLVVAQGAGNSVTVAEITEAVMALFGVEAHKIKVMKME